MRIPRTNFSTAALHDAHEADGFEHPHPGAPDVSHAQTTLASPQDHLFEAPEAPRRGTGHPGDDMGYAGRAARLYGHCSPYAPAQVTAWTRDPLPTLAEITGQSDGPSWESHFFLSPNVRFTRTPEREFMKRRAPAADEGEVEVEATAAEVVEAEIVAETGPVDAVPAAVEPQTPAHSPSELLRVLMQQLPSWRPAQSRDAATAEPALNAAPIVKGEVPELEEAGGTLAPAVHAADVAEMIPAGREPASDSAARVVTGEREARLSYLSDHAFFEFMPLEMAAAMQVAAEPVEEPAMVPQQIAAAPTPVAAPVEIQPQPPTAITSMFRVVECRPATTVIAAPVPVPPPSAPDKPEAVAVAAAPALVEPVVKAEEKTPVSNVPVTKAAITMPAVVQRSASPFPPIGGSERQQADAAYEFPAKELLQEPPQGQGFFMTQEQLEQNAGLLESVLEDFGVKGEIIHVRPGPVVTLYEFEPAPGVKSSRVIGLADDIARSMSALSARVAVVPGRNVIGIELPNATRETVYFRELIESNDFQRTGCKLALCLGKTIGGEPVIAELAKMPHLLVAGTTGSGKSVAINTMILSLLYRLKPEECRLIMVDPKMLELSVYDGIPHLLTPVVTDPKKAVMALKWAVREMEDRYRKMSRLGVRNIDGYNQRAAAAREKGEPILATVQTGFEKGTGEPLFEQQEMDLAPMPYIVVIVDEMADLMMVAGKEIEGAIQRLAQMARAAGIHLIMATQRPSVDVITGTIKANFPTRISFQVTSKIDSRTILGEQGAEQLLGQGDMLYMAGGGRIQRVHGPFVSDLEVEHVVAHLKTQGRPEYLETVTADEEEEEPEEDQGAVFDKSAIAAEDGNELYEQAVKVVLRDKKCSTSYIQRRLGIGYNRAASLVERMEKEGLVGPANHVGKREIIHGNRDHAAKADDAEME
ncbi:DNA translocase FtsK [Sinorhizobium fredii]|uniref:Cell division DNA translocase FtsK/SpoIIIE family protein n=1 Tax=Rhizobium fredii TaxID=380 RepID=A0A2L0HG95_RHIFR|nr:DNA translocase FtsK [Sinorhizobium fredii]AUX80506.1 cell division DNA translocase FtsK/SpoIIIE family protein [Sinorhizobium fredii]